MNQKSHMSEAVVDDIVAVLPPLLQSLEALGFVARHLNPPDFGRVMEAAGTPDEALRAVRPRLAQWPEEFRGHQDCARSGQRCGAGRVRGLARRAERQWRSRQRVSRAALRSRARRRRCIRCAAKLPPVSEFFVDPALREDAELAARLAAPGQREHRHHSRPQRARQPRRLLALRAGILHARTAPGRW